MAVGTLKSNAFGLHAINPAMSIPLMEGYEKASQTFKDGAILKRDTGTLAVAGADNTADIVGVAAAPASGVRRYGRLLGRRPAHRSDRSRFSRYL